MLPNIRLTMAVAALGCVLAASSAQAQQKPNILVIFGDDVGVWNISAYHRGMMGGRTPNIDRIAKEGPFEVSPDAALYTRWYGDQMWMFVPAQAYVTRFLSTFKEFPPSQAVGSLSVEKVLQQMQAAASRQ